MTIKTRFNRGDAVVWISPDYHIVLTGKVETIAIDVNKEGTVGIDYMVQCDEPIKGSRSHYLNEEYLQDIKFKAAVETMWNHRKQPRE